MILTEKDLEQAAVWLKEGKLVAFPTETVYGLGAPVFSPETIQKIFQVKGRPSDNPLIAHISELEQVELLAKDLPPSFLLLANTFFPGPLTLILRKKDEVPSIVTAGLDTIAIRMPDHPLSRKLISAANTPLVAPSANLSGRPSSTCAQHVLEDFEDAIAGVLDGGDCAHGIESTVLDLVSFAKPTLLRPGAITKEELEKVLGSPIDIYTEGPKSSPGMKYRHYCPDVPVHFFQDKGLLATHLSLGKNPYLVVDLQAKTLYSHLRYAEKNGYDEVVLYSEKKLSDGLKNRIQKITAEACH